MKTFGSIQGVFCMVILFFLTLSTKAQEQKTIAFEIEADPIAYLFKGYSLHAGIVHGHWRHSVGAFGIDQPDFALSNDAFDVFSRGVDFKTDYLFGKGRSGLLVGMQANYTWDKVSYESSFSKRVSGLNVGPRIGYRFFLNNKEEPAKGIYLVPWATFSYTTNNEAIRYNEQEYKPSSWFLFPTFHVGWRF